MPKAGSTTYVMTTFTALARWMAMPCIYFLKCFSLLFGRRTNAWFCKEPKKLMMMCFCDLPCAERLDMRSRRRWWKTIQPRWQGQFPHYHIYGVSQRKLKHITEFGWICCGTSFWAKVVQSKQKCPKLAKGIWMAQSGPTSPQKFCSSNISCIST